MTGHDEAPEGQAALCGLRVLEIAQLVAGPMAGTLLADLGADVVHLEDPAGGDPQRRIGAVKEGTYLWWKVAARNKRSATCDLRQPEGRELARSLAQWADVVITNFRVGTLERWELDWQALHQVHPALVMLQVSGYGTDTSLRDSPGFGKVGEAMSGVVNLTGFPDGPPLHAGYSNADSLTGLMGAFAIQAALYRRANDPEFSGELIDLALFESHFRLIEWQVIIQDQLGVPPQRAGNQLPGFAGGVVNAFLTRDDRWITVSAGTPRSAVTLADMLGEEMDPNGSEGELQATSTRVEHRLGEWMGARSAASALSELEARGVVASKIFDTADILSDRTYQERQDIIAVDDEDLGSIRMQAVVPKLRNHRGQVWRPGPALGADNQLVYKEYLGMSDTDYDRLVANLII
jgi:crotonobetainyl-CoA:carnitine CoA-transferase CaiB-like acyl-CoA transferase